MRRAFITGVSGQDGSYLSELLLGEDVEVFGLVRRKADSTNWRIRHLLGDGRFHLVHGDVLDLSALVKLLGGVRPQFVFNLAAQSFVPFSWEAPVATAQVTACGVLNVLEAIRLVDPGMRFYQASSSEIFGAVRESPQTEATPPHPRSPYGVSKTFGHWITVNYRESHGLFACSGILFNHESERRGIDFVSRKITYAAAQIKAGQRTTLALGNLDAARDWGYARDYVRAMWLMLNASEPGDYVIATGVSHTVRDLCATAFAAVGLRWEDHVVTDPSLLRPAEVHTLLGDATKARSMLRWAPAVSFEEMVQRMLAADQRRVGEGNTYET